VNVDNDTIARRLTEHARALDEEGGNLFRARAFRRAAEVVRSLVRPAAELFEQQGRAGLAALPGVSASVAVAIESLLRTGEVRRLRPADAQREPERLLTSLPGVGRQLALRLEDELGITTLEGLERAAHEGRLVQVGVGPKRLRGILDALAGRMHQTAVPEPVGHEPSVDDLLAVDEEFRRLGAWQIGREREGFPLAWRAERNGWRYRAQFANTAVAHRLGKARDWVVVGFEDGMQAGQRTVVTEATGDLSGQRVVRGRERECRAHYLALAGREPAA
jgi:hypothetical protein